MNEGIVTVDVREDIRTGGEPFSKIMSAVAALRGDQSLRLIAPFEPVPLFTVLAKKGFQHTAMQVGPAQWEVLFSQTLDPVKTGSVSQSSPDASGPSTPTDIVELNLRGLEPPQPLVKILETLGTLPEGTEMLAHTDRRPIHLHSHLEERGFAGESEEQTDGSYITHIRRR